MSLRLRVATAADADDIATLVNRAYRPAPHERGWTHEADLVSGDRISPEQVRSLSGPESIVLTLFQGSALVACVHIRRDQSSAYIGMLATTPDQQAQGVGKEMLAHAEKYAVEHFGATSFKMSVLSSRPELLAFYQRRGYVLGATVESYPVDAGVGQPMVDGLQVLALHKQSARPVSAC